MASVTTKIENDLPLADLQRVGIDKEALNSMPQTLLESLRRGEITPLVLVSIPASNGKIVQMPLRLQVIHDTPTGEPRLMAYPTRNSIENSIGLSRYELDRVTSGETLKKELLTSDGRKIEHFIQFDARTNSLVKAPMEALPLEARCKEVESIHNIQLGVQQKEQIRNGQPVELEVGDQKVTVGVDLHEPHAFKIVNGDLDEWRRRQIERYDIAHPEVMGFVQTDRNRWEYARVVDRDHGVEQNRHMGQERSEGMKI